MYLRAYLVSDCMPQHTQMCCTYQSSNQSVVAALFVVCHRLLDLCDVTPVVANFRNEILWGRMK